MVRRFEDRVAIITGALGGIGLATAKRLATEGARLVLVDLAPEIAAERMNTAIRDCLKLGSPEAIGLHCDVANEAEVNRVFDTTVKRYGRIDVIVNVAGLTRFKSLVELNRGDWNELLGVNLMGAVFFTQRALREMAPGSAIVNVSSIHAVQTSPLMGPYAAAKAALLSLTRTTAIEGKPLGVRANAILPGAVDTPMLWSNPNLASGVEKIDPNDVGNPQEIAAAIAFLASHEATFINGSALTIDGGRLASL